MRITKLGDYAIRTVLHLATGKPGEIFRISEISHQRDIPESFLHKIIPLLKKAGLIRSIRGHKGGIILAANARNISILKVIEAVEGEIALNGCVLNPGSCPQIGRCAMHGVWVESHDRLRETLAEKTVADLTGWTKQTGRAAG